MLNTDLSIFYIFLYLFIYNSSLYIFFIILNYFIFELKTTNLFNKLNNIYNFKISMIYLLLSIAGIPPFFGFFIKLTLLYYIAVNSFLWCLLFTITLLISLYFYLQNIRFLMWLDNDLIKSNNWHIKFIKISLIFNLLIISFVLIGGVFLYDDLILIILYFFI